MKDVTPYLRMPLEKLLHTMGLDPKRLTLCTAHAHASYYLNGAAFSPSTLPQCSQITINEGYVNFTFTIDFLGSFFPDFLESLPSVTLAEDVKEDEIFSTLPYCAWKYTRIARGGAAVIPDDPRAAGSLLQLYALAQWENTPMRSAKANTCAIKLLAFFDTIKRSDYPRYFGFAIAVIRALTYIHNKGVNP